MLNSLRNRIIYLTVNAAFLLSVLKTVPLIYSYKICQRTCYRDIEADTALAKYICIQDEIVSCPLQYFFSKPGFMVWMVSIAISTIVSILILNKKDKAVVLGFVVLIFMQFFVIFTKNDYVVHNKVEWKKSIKAVYMKKNEDGSTEICDGPCKKPDSDVESEELDSD